MLTPLLGAALAATPVVGLDFTPSSTRADLIWVDQDQSSGTLLGEFDGYVRPPLTPYGGLLTEHWAFLFNASFGRTRDIDWTPEARRSHSATAIRPGVDAQRYLIPRELGKPTLWVGGGVFGTIPLATDDSTAYTSEEIDAAAEGEQATRSRIVGVGGRAGFGAELLLREGLTLGLRAQISAWQAWSVDEGRYARSALYTPETALRLQFEF